MQADGRPRSQTELSERSTHSDINQPPLSKRSTHSDINQPPLSKRSTESDIDQPPSKFDEDPEHVVDNTEAPYATNSTKPTDNNNTETMVAVDIESRAEYATKDAAATGESARENDESSGRKGACSKTIGKIQDAIHGFFQKNSTVLWRLFYALLFLLYLVYFVAALIHKFGDEGSICLLVMTLLVFTYLMFRLIENMFKQTTIVKSWNERTATKGRVLIKKVKLEFSLAITVILFSIFYVLLTVARTHPRNLVSLCGMAVFLVLLYVFSYNPARVNWSPVVWGILIQFMFAVLILKTKWGYESFAYIGDRITEFLAFTDAGSKFVFGSKYMDHFFAFKVVPVVVFFSTSVTMLYYLGFMQLVIRNAGRFLSFCLGTSATESLNAAANIFIGAGEAPLLVRPFLEDMTMSELHAVLTGGFATIAGAVMAAYILYGVPASHLLSASVMSAPAALAVSKLFYPETEKVKHTKEQVFNMPKGTERNIIEAASSGASQSIVLTANIVVNLIAFIALLEFFNAVLSWFGDRIGMQDPKLTFQLICSYTFYPLAFLMGVDTEDCLKLGNLIGTKIFLNEFIAYLDLATYISNRKILNEYIRNSISNTTAYPTGFWNYTNDGIYLKDTNTFLEKGLMSEKSTVVATYALCGFSNLSSMGMMLGSVGGMAPGRRSDLAQLVFRAMIAGNVACFMTACIAGTLTT